MNSPYSYNRFNIFIIELYGHHIFTISGTKYGGNTPIYFTIYLTENIALCGQCGNHNQVSNSNPTLERPKLEA